MGNYFMKRILMAVPVLLGISILSFILGIMAPGDPVEFVLNQEGLNDPTPEQLETMRAELGLNRPLIVQYGSWLYRVLHGDLGTSYISGKNIAWELWTRLQVTLEIALLALLLAGIGGIILGTIAALYNKSVYEKTLNGLSNILLAIPGFWLALVLILVFAENLRWLPTSGNDSWRHLILPALILALPTMATICRFMRNILLAEFTKQYFIVARVRGLKRWKLLLYYALPNALLPVIALLGNYFAGVLGGSVIIESIFALPGVGMMAIEGIRFRDYPVLQAYVLLSGTIMVLVTMGVDLLMSWLNPKIRLGE